MRSSGLKRSNVTQPAKAKQPAARRSATSSLLWKLVSTSSQHTDRLGQTIGRVLRGGETIALYGPLGAGKTALVRGIAQGLGASPTAVTSPTFVVIHEYQGRLPLAHMDLYRINSLRELESTGLLEYFSGQTVTAIEWADKGLALLPKDRIEITLNHRAAQSRTIQLSATGPTSDDVLARARGVHQALPHRVSDKKGTTRS
jgi:tRNA threonylcarbamoyladenosine biosynthesis protein TsaE